MANLHIRAAQVICPSTVMNDATVRIAGTRIGGVDQANRLPAMADAEVLEGAVLLPGFIDLHWHGFGGHGLGNGPEAARAAVRRVAESGVTTCYAGLGAGPSFEAIAGAVTGAAAVVGVETGGARLAGIFMEGPWISVAKKGAWNPAHLRLPSIREMQELIAASDERIRRINVAPELPGALDFIRAARAAGIVISLGHSDATYEQALAGIEAGATITNHTYNAMSGLGHRSPGLAGATLTTDALLAEVILDGVHVHPAAAQVLMRARGAGGIALITDGSQMMGVGEGTYSFGGRTVTLKDGCCRLPDGTIAGSVSPFDRDLHNAAAWLGADLLQLAAMSSGNAARVMGIDAHTGSIESGKDADLVLLDADLHVLATIVRGEVVYRRPPELDSK